MKGAGTFLAAFILCAIFVNILSGLRKTPDAPSVPIQSKPTSLADCLASVFPSVLAQSISSGKQGEGATIVVLFEMKEAWSEASMKRNIEQIMWEAYYVLYTCGPPVQLVDLKARTRLMNRYGQEELETVYRTSLTQTVANKINWDNRERLDQTKIWKTIFLHPLFFRDELHELFR